MRNHSDIDVTRVFKIALLTLELDMMVNIFHPVEIIDLSSIFEKELDVKDS